MGQYCNGPRASTSFECYVIAGFTTIVELSTYLIVDPATMAASKEHEQPRRFWGYDTHA
jgi:hypothetical protein